MKKAIVGLAAVGAIVGIRRAKRMSQKMREHCAQMAAQCKQMAAQVGTRGEPVGKT
jgi:gas vesicle protein